MRAFDVLQRHPEIVKALDACSRAKRWWVGVSGGADSIALLHIVQAYLNQHALSRSGKRVDNRQEVRVDTPSGRAEYKFDPHSSSQIIDSGQVLGAYPSALPLVRVVNIDHQIQAQSKGWSEAVSAHCATLGIHCEVHEVVIEEQGQGLEAAARNARYRVFESLLEEDDALLVAHHLDDQLETFLMRAFRGAGPDGLQAMSSRRALGKGDLVRPLLSVPRSELEAVAASAFPDYIRDPSNFDERFDRGFMRSQLVPLIKQRWPAAAENVGRAVRLLQHEFSASHDVSSDVSHARTGEPVCALPMGRGAAVQCRLLRAWLKTLGHYPPSYASLSEFVSQIDHAKSDSVPVLSSAEYRLKYYDGQVYLCPANDPTSSPITEQEVLLNKPFQLPLGYFTLVSDVGEASKPITVRSRKPGERVALESKRPSQPIKRLFKEWGVPPWWRNQVPLFECEGVLIGVLDQLADVSPQGAQGRAESLQQIIWQPISHLD